MQKRQLILGSTSKPRYSLLQRLQIPFEVAAPNIDETPELAETPENLVRRLALQKAKEVAKQFPDALIIGADQVGVIDGVIQGKPLTYENAYVQLQNASGKTIRFFIGLCLYDARDKTYQIAIEEFDVVYRKLSLQTIEKYLKKEQPLECAGSCKAEGLGITLIEEFRGKDFTALIGLPLIRLVDMLEKADVDLLDMK
jgi:septum formation protein